jgi:hypothetical protein
MDLDKALKKTKKKRTKMQGKSTKPYTAVSERPYENDLTEETPSPVLLERSSTSIVLSLLTCFAHDAFDEARQRATQTVARLKDRVKKALEVVPEKRLD